MPLASDAASQESMARFEREVQVTSALSHPNTIEIFDYGHTPDGTFYYAMEYLDGLTLSSCVESEGAQPEARVVHVRPHSATLMITRATRELAVGERLVTRQGY